MLIALGAMGSCTMHPTIIFHQFAYTAVWWCCFVGKGGSRGCTLEVGKSVDLRLKGASLAAAARLADAAALCAPWFLGLACCVIRLATVACLLSLCSAGCCQGA
jgi:hypothetical protein